MERDGMIFMHKIMADLRRDEGFMQYPYHCTGGALTIGYGRNLDAKGISHAEADILLRNDVVEAQADLERVCPLASSLSDNRYRALLNMVFNLGSSRFMTFRNMLAAIRAGNYDRAADEMLDSKWARQVGIRAERLAEIMRRG